MCVKFRFFKMKSWKDSVTIKCCLLCKGRTIYSFTSMKWVQSICFVCSISRACQRLKKLQGLELKISAIRIVLTFFMSIWLKFSVLCKPFYIKSEWFSASCRWSILEMGSRVALPTCRKAVEALQQEPQVSARLLGCPGGIVSPSFSLNMHHTAAQAVHKPRGQKGNSAVWQLHFARLLFPASSRGRWKDGKCLKSALWTLPVPGCVLSFRQTFGSQESTKTQNETIICV